MSLDNQDAFVMNRLVEPVWYHILVVKGLHEALIRFEAGIIVVCFSVFTNERVPKRAAPSASEIGAQVFWAESIDPRCRLTRNDACSYRHQQVSELKHSQLTHQELILGAVWTRSDPSNYDISACRCLRVHFKESAIVNVRNHISCRVLRPIRSIVTYTHLHLPEMFPMLGIIAHVVQENHEEFRRLAQIHYELLGVVFNTCRAKPTCSMI